MHIDPGAPLKDDVHLVGSSRSSRLLSLLRRSGSPSGTDLRGNERGSQTPCCAAPHLRAPTTHHCREWGSSFWFLSGSRSDCSSGSRYASHPVTCRPLRFSRSFHWVAYPIFMPAGERRS